MNIQQIITTISSKLVGFYQRSFGVIVLAGCVSVGLGFGGQALAAGSIPGWETPIKISKKKFKFDGELSWVADEGHLTPRLEGTLALKDAGGMCGRMRLDYYDSTHFHFQTKYGGDACAKGDKRQEWDVDLAPYESNKIYEVKVSIEKKTAKNDWKIIGSASSKIVTITDSVKITEDGFDFGGETFAAGAPTKSATVQWTWKQGTVTPRVIGTIHINNAASACARLQIEYWSDDANLLATKVGGKTCASDNSHWYHNVDLSKYSHYTLGSIRINLQTLRADETWRTIGSAWSHLVKTGLSYE